MPPLPSAPVTAAAAVAGVRSGDSVFIGSGAAEPSSLADALTDRADELRDVRIYHIYTLGSARYCEPQYAKSFRHVAFFVGENVRAAVQEGRADFIPVHLHEVPRLLEARERLDWAFVQLSPPDRHGYCTVGVSAEIVVAALRTARHVVAEINPQMPRTWGDTQIHLSDIEAVVEVDHPLPEVEPLPPSDVAQRIGAHVASIVRDGDCLQAGIGGIPNAVLAALRDHRHLGVHTEALTDGIVDLHEFGAMDNSRKTVRPGKVVASFALGTRRLYDWIDDSPIISLHGAEYVNDPRIIAANDNVVALNAAIEVDLTGQVNADSIGSRVFSGIGGQVDFIRGASESSGGRPVIALPSTAVRGTVSRIVPALRTGAGVVTSRGDVHYVATEWGIVDLFGVPLRDRVEALIGIAHPDFREQLERDAVALGLLRARR